MEAASAPGSGSQAAQQRIFRHQHAAEVMRARSILAAAFVLWIVTGFPVDIAAHPALGTGSLAFALIVRAAASAYHLVVLGCLYRSVQLPPRVVDALIASVFPVTALAIMLIATVMGGLTSPYALVVSVGIMVQVTAAPKPWKRGGALVGTTVAMYVVGMLVATRFDTGLRAQLDDRVARTTFAVFAAVLVAGAIGVTWAGHVLWSLRRSVFESRNLGRYRLIKRIGRGGMGEVWRAQDRALRREVALKILSPEYGRHPAAIARFEREIQATSEVSHRNVIRIHDWGVTDDGVWYYAMDLLHGADLFGVVKQVGAMPAELVVNLGTGVAAGLAEAHRRGVVHRDIKPGNMFVEAPDGEPVRIQLLDFGIARVESDSELTQPGAVMGTPGFMAPEVLAGAPGGVAADVYGLAAALFYALTGTNPLDAAGAPASALVAGVPLALDDLLARGMDREPSRRPGCAGEFERALAACGTVWTGSWRIDRVTSTPPDDIDAPPTIDPDSPPTLADSLRRRPSA
ncbi:MAG TPA: serine/threonine-protein kinase [Kofleriaceae bacterium]